MSDKTKAWLVVGLLILCSAEPSPADIKPAYENGQWSWQDRPQQRESDADFYARQNYYLLLQQQQREYEAQRQYQQDKRNYGAQQKQQLMMEAFD